MPSLVPTSARPSMSSWVGTVSASTAATEELDQNTIDDYTSTIPDYYGVVPSDVTIESTYAASGSMTISIPESATETELVDAVTTSIADSL
eukprot:UN26483